MSYFSNHSSQSRFLAISSSSSTSSPAHSTPSQAAGSTTSSGASAGQAQRPRASSKHFSTSVEAHAHGNLHGDLGEDEEDALVGPRPTVHPLRNTWVFWFRQQRSPGNKIISYEEGIKRVAAFGSVESFWALHTHLTPPSLLTPTTDYLLFHSGVQRPVWEDPLNIGGGKWIIRLRKGVADRVWEGLLCAVVGDAFAECRDPPPRANWEDSDDDTTPSAEPSHADESGESVGDDLDVNEGQPEICGVTISVRQSEDIVSLWNRVDRDVTVRERIRDTLRQVLNLPASTIMEYKSNNDSMQDKSSFRNSAIDRTGLGTA
ncbi:translation initiation factor eIF4e [Mycena alexandri]|uniref:Translation initiation factor eIF4e n=1 Tax=Mycena alexandri TaxID=1745969 RepID=A0AAD6XB14_9AGAR|nr:translation initiation factor eIF4e [Mycena alexandri]